MPKYHRCDFCREKTDRVLLYGKVTDFITVCTECFRKILPSHIPMEQHTRYFKRLYVRRKNGIQKKIAR